MQKNCLKFLGISFSSPFPLTFPPSLSFSLKTLVFVADLWTTTNLFIGVAITNFLIDRMPQIFVFLNLFHVNNKYLLSISFFIRDFYYPIELFLHSYWILSFHILSFISHFVRVWGSVMNFEEKINSLMKIYACCIIYQFYIYNQLVQYLFYFKTTTYQNTPLWKDVSNNNGIYKCRFLSKMIVVILV